MLLVLSALCTVGWTKHRPISLGFFSEDLTRSVIYRIYNLLGSIFGVPYSNVISIVFVNFLEIPTDETLPVPYSYVINVLTSFMNYSHELFCVFDVSTTGNLVCFKNFIFSINNFHIICYRPFMSFVQASLNKIPFSYGRTSSVEESWFNKKLQNLR